MTIRAYAIIYHLELESILIQLLHRFLIRYMLL